MEFASIGVKVVDEGASAHLSNLVVGLGLFVTWLEDSECTKIRQFLRHKGFALRILGGWVAHPFQMSVSKDDGLRKEILSKTHHSPYIVHPRSTKMYKNEERSGLELSTYLSSSSL